VLNHIVKFLISSVAFIISAVLTRIIGNILHKKYMSVDVNNIIALILILGVYLYFCVNFDKYLYNFRHDLVIFILVLFKDITFVIGVLFMFDGRLVCLQVLDKTFLNLIMFSRLSIIAVMYWQYTTIRHESYIECTNTYTIKKRMRTAFVLFLRIELIVFGSLFWAYFHYSLTEIWPPIGISKCNHYRLPLFNTCLLLRSGVSLTAYHNYILVKNHNNSNRLVFLELTTLLGLIFIYVQYIEYNSHLCFRLSDGIYGRVFYSLTGFHGLHVAIGITILLTCSRLSKYAIYNNHMGITASIWYWHFVDVIWVILFIFVYVY